LLNSPNLPPYLARTRYIRPTFANPFPRTRYIRYSIHLPAFAKMRLAFDTFARVIRHFGEFGASGHCLVNFLLDENTEWYEKHWYLIFIDFQRSEITIEIFKLTEATVLSLLFNNNKRSRQSNIMLEFWFRKHQF